MRDGRPVLLYGAGAEARSTRAYLAEASPETKVYVTADSGGSDITDAEWLPPAELGAAIAAGRFDTLIKSPGVSLYKPVMAEMRAAGIVITSNLNLWGARYGAGTRVIAITGTKGKSTTATLCHDMLTASGVASGLGGNVGVPPLDLGDRNDLVVLELSSYQTADMDFAPDIAAVTTLYSEHVDWHQSRERYFADKLRLLDLEPKPRLAFGPQAATHALVATHLDDPARLLPAIDDGLADAIAELAPHTRLRGQHNIDNAVLAAVVATACGASRDGILAAIDSFKPLPHRLADIRIGDHLFIDDSISTTPEATEAALAAFAGRSIALIAGGYDRQQDYAHLAERIGTEGAALVVCLPDTGARLAAELRRRASDIPLVEAPDLDAAMRAIALRRTRFDTIILSPGAPSYNQFRNFSERGDAFVTLARRLFG
ncbi:MAG: UDP-N-acetylmuramoyl-L-alanine--D-glutamate ligase [Alphaproteobacteria bacterium]|nr:UDP-N-acetylmuramoyl-L-alanine--D-glutamate ligase [Alphaproteobacteria bacterium]